MKLHNLKIEGFRRCYNASINFGDATFLIGENNVGKSTVLRAIQILLSGERKLPEDDYCMEYVEEDGNNRRKSEKVILTGEFRNVPLEALEWKGFKGRIFKYNTDDENDTKLSIFYRKTFVYGQDVIVEMKCNKKTLKEEYKECKTPKDYIDNGIDRELIIELFGEDNLEKKLTKKQNDDYLELINDIWDIDNCIEEWVANPGGFVGVVLSKLPKFILIPAQDRAEEIGEDGKKGTLIEIMQEIFEEVRCKSQNYKEAQKYLDELTKELDPRDEQSEFGRMMSDVNSVLDGVFPNSRLHAYANLSDPNKVLKPEFEVKLSSNIMTRISYQGTGMIRATAFSLLRYREDRIKRMGDINRTIIIGFEEPEIYLHPNAANQMRDTIYNLATNTSQIVCTTHSPYMIDLSRKPKQVLNNFTLNAEGNVNSLSFNISEKFEKLTLDDKDYIKMLLKIDDYIARVFFAKRVVIIEGDTEDVVLRETIDKLPNRVKTKIYSEVQIVKARGKATIISLIRYLKSLGIDIFVVHDRDQGVDGAEVFNKRILEELGSEDKRIMVQECIEDVLGYEAKNEKPYKAYCQMKKWSSWSEIPPNLKRIMSAAFREYIPKEEAIIKMLLKEKEEILDIEEAAITN